MLHPLPPAQALDMRVLSEHWRDVDAVRPVTELCSAPFYSLDEETEASGGSVLFCGPTVLAVLFSLWLLQICSSQLCGGANLGGGAKSLRSCAWLPRATGGWLEAPTPSPAWSLLAEITALQRSNCCPPAGPLASGPGCQPAGRGGSLAGSQLTVPGLSAGRQARQG